MSWGRDERVDDIYFEEKVGEPTEDGQCRNTGTDLKFRIGGVVKSLTRAAATQVGQVLFSVDGSTFVAELPITGPQGWLVNNDGILIVNG